jgi:uncharacterized SAM-binding protein YcdF (DUF218 family)
MRWRLAIGLPACALAAGFAWFAATVPQPAEAPPQADGIAVLTGGAGRIETALALLREGHGRMLLITGVYQDTTLNEILRLPEGTDAGNDAQRITLGRWARSTRGNAIEIAAWADAGGIDSVRVVTAGYHMRRALLEISRAAPGHLLVPQPVATGRFADGTWWREAATLRIMVVEYLKYLGAASGLSRLAPAREAAAA